MLPWLEPGCQTQLCLTHGPAHAWPPLREQHCGWPVSLPVTVVLPLAYWWLWYHWLHPILSPALASMRQAVPTGAAHTCQQVLPVGSWLQWGDFPVLMRLGRLGPSTCQLSLRY